MSLFNVLSATLIVLILAAGVILITGLQVARADLVPAMMSTTLR